jgi:hypothetical protein
MPSSFRPQPAKAVAQALAALPVIKSSDAGRLGAAQIALARAIASGQDAGELGAALSAQSTWLGIDLRGGAAQTHPAVAARTKVTKTPPAWAVSAAEAAVQAASAVRIAVLDRDPSTVSSLSLPAWAIGQKAATSYGPILIENPESQLTVEKWLKIFIVPVQMATFVQGSTTLFVAPCAATGSAKSISLAAGSVWINVASFASGSSADSFAGIAVQAGTITSDQPLTLGGPTVTVPAGASLTLTVNPAAPTSSGTAASTVTAPASMTFTYPAGKSATAAIADFSATVCGESFACRQASQPAVYNGTLNTLAFPFSTNQTQFAPNSTASTMLSLQGSASLELAGWALQVAQSAPAQLGNAASAGLFYLGFATGISALWSGLSRPEPEGGGIGLASGDTFLLWTAAGLAPNATTQLKFQLWDAQQIPSTMTATRSAGAGLLYEISSTNELIELGATLGANLDRPLYADESRAPVAIPDGLVFLTANGGHQRVFAYAAFTTAEIPAVLKQNPNGFPMALDNALLSVSVPLLFVMEGVLAQANTSGSYLLANGALLVGFTYQLAFPFFPDPYASPQVSLEDSGTGGLLAEVAWTGASQVSMRMIDLQHAHPAQPPSNEASSDLTSGASPVTGSAGVFAIGLGDTNLKPQATLDFPFQFDATPASGVVETPGPFYAPPPGIPVPPPLPGLMMLDVSTRASLFGVEIIDFSARSAQTLLTIDGLSARTYAVLAPAITLPSISWEPMYNLAAPVAGSPTDKLRNPPDDGPVCAVGADSVTLVPVAPIQALGAILSATEADSSTYGAVLTLPYGTVAGIAQTVGPNAGPVPALTQPTFDVPAASGPDVTLTGAYQLTLRPPPGDPNAPLFAGRTYLRTQEDNPSGELSYGEEVLGLDVEMIFTSQFNTPANGGVPLKRYDLTGYGASLASDWTNLNPPDPTAIIQVDYTTTVGRTSHEIVQAQSVIYPWGIKVVRTITIDRLNSGSVERTDSGWIAASGGDFTYIATASGNDIKSTDVHKGVIDSLMNVRNVQEFGLPLVTQGTSDDTGGAAGQVTLQPVTFDAEVAINAQHQVLQGGSQQTGLNQTDHTAVPSTGIVGYISLTAEYHLSLNDLLSFLSNLNLPQPAGGPMNSLLNLGSSGNAFRTVAMSADPAIDDALNKDALVVAARGLPVLPAGSAWTVALKQTTDVAPRSLAPTQPVPVVQPNDGSGNPGTETHFADPSDIFRLAANPPTPPGNLYGFLQDVTTQKTFLAQPFITNATQQLSLRQVPSLADPGALLGAVSSFPTIASALPLKGLENLVSTLGAQNLAIDKWFDTDSNKVTPLIQTSVAVVDLVYRWDPDGPQPTQPNPDDKNARIHITLGQPSGPSWSIDIYEVALKLFIPPVDASTPALWIEGSFHADSETLPSFPDLQVVYDGPLQPLTQFFTTLQKLGSVLGPGGASPEVVSQDDASGGGSSDDGGGLNVHFADGTLTVQDTFALPSLPLGPGYIENISLNLGASIDILNTNVGFLVGIGSPDAPVHWIVDPLSGTGCLQAGVQDGSLAVLIQLGLGLGLAIDLGVASGGASITIAFQVQINGTTYELLLLLTGQAQVTVLGGVASASISLSCGLGLEIQAPSGGEIEATAIGTAAVAIHISICWVVSIDFSGSWTFSHQFEIPA